MRLGYTLRRSAALASAAAVALAVPVYAAAEDVSSEVFFDDFSGDAPDTGKWLIAEKNWGGTVTEDGVTKDYNGGVIAGNVSLRDGCLVLTGLGNGYSGGLRGINRDGSRREDGKRCGGAIATRDYRASGSYEIRARIAPEPGCCSAMWTFEYEEDYSGDDLRIVNHEIDIEFPGRDREGGLSLSHALCTTWVTEEDYKTESVDCGAQADGEFHTYRFDWHTGSDSEEPRVEYYFDGRLAYTSREYIPTNESRFWLGLWFPKNWAGTPDFEQTEFEVDYVRITPFHESGDTPQHESYPGSGWDEKAEIPKGWLLWHSYSDYSALDSRLYLRSPDGEVSEIKGSFIHAMNGSFGRDPGTFTFMAIDETGDEWDIFLYRDGIITNLTEGSGYRNEDPKFSPDGRRIVFKRGRWDSSIGDLSYDLALLDTETGEVTMLTDAPAEEAMPCFSADGRYIYYAGYEAGIGAIYRLDTAAGSTETVFSEEDVTAYYPVVYGDDLYFTKWYSAGNRCDQLMKRDGATFTALPFDSESYDCSDACPLGGDRMIFSSTMNGSYDLYYYDGKRTAALTECSSDNNDLGAAFFPAEKVRGDVNADGALNAADLVLFQKWLLGVPETVLRAPEAADLSGDGVLDTYDMCFMRRLLTS